MMQRLTNKKIMFGLIGGLLLLAVFSHWMMTSADAHSFVIWEKTAKDNELHITLMLSANEDVQKAGTFQIRFGFETDDVDGIDTAEFRFDSKIDKDPDITVKTSRFNKANGTLTVYVSGNRDNILEQGKALSLGTLSVKADREVSVSVIPEGCKVADEEYQEHEITVFGSSESVIIGKNKIPETPEESIPPETPEESTSPETPEESTPPETPEESSPSETPKESITPETPEESTPPETSEESSSSEKTEIPEDNDREKESDNREKKDPEETEGTWRLSEGTWKFMKENGVPAQNEWIKVNGSWYWIDADGGMATGWINLNNIWYFCGPSGEMKTGWVNTGDHWYFLDTSGAMRRGWVQDKGVWYYLEESGAMKTGWTAVDGKWYFLTNEGKMLADTVTPDGIKVDKSGARVN